MTGASSILSRVVPTSSDADEPPSLSGHPEVGRVVESPVLAGSSDNAPVDEMGAPLLSPLNTFRSTETVQLGEDERELHDRGVRDRLIRDAEAARFPVASARVYGLPPISSKVYCQNTPNSNAAPFGSGSVDGGRNILRDSWRGELDPPKPSTPNSAHVPALPTRSRVEDAGRATTVTQGSGKSSGITSAASGLGSTIIGENEDKKGGGNGVRGADGRRGDEATAVSSKPVTFKTVSFLPGVLRLQAASDADKRNEDISVDINSLSKITNTETAEALPRYLLYHESAAKLGWDIFMMALIILSSFVSPLEIGFDFQTSATLVFDLSVEVFFVFDVALNFRTTFVDTASRETVTDTKKISIRYLKGWFMLDTLSSLPVALISHVVDVHGMGLYFMSLKLLRALKLRQLSVITNAVLKRFEDKDFNPSVFRIYAFVLAFVLVLHFIACAFWAVSRLTDPYFEGTWTPEDFYLDLGIWTKYSRALYFALVITYGNDLQPDNVVEYVFSNMCLTLALLTNAVIIGSATNLLSNMDAGAVAKKSQIDSINGYMRVQKVPRGLQKKIRTFYEYLWDSGQDNHSTGLFEELPEKLKLQLNIVLKRQLIEKVPLFKTCSPAGVIALVQNLIPIIILPGDLITRQGEPATSMFFISKGAVSVCVLPETNSNDYTRTEEKYVISLVDGSFFGEVALLKEKHVRTANIRAEIFTELQVLHGEDFQALAEVFPEFKTAVDEISKSRLKASDSLAKFQMKEKVTSPAGASISWNGSVRKDREGGGLDGMNTFRQAVAHASAENSVAKEEDRQSKPRLQSLAERLLTRRHMNNETVLCRSAAMPGAAERGSFRRARSGMFSFASHQSISLSSTPRTIYERIVAHEATMSHETAMCVARGGGIRPEDLLTMENLRNTADDDPEGS